MRPTLEKILREGFMLMTKSKVGTYQTYAKGDERIMYNSNKDSIELRYIISKERN
jgi:hypothetical protein